jgi:hypothetical protein
MEFQTRPIVPFEFKVPTYVPIQAPKQEELISGIVKLVSYGVNLALTDPEEAKTFAKTCVVVGAVGVGIWALTKLLN